MAKIWQILLLLCVLKVPWDSAEVIDEAELGPLCYPPQLRNNHRACQCSEHGVPPWGSRAVLLDCSYKRLQSDELASVLPIYADTLDLSWNGLSKLPAFNSVSLTLLNLMHNNITLLARNNFADLTNLRELYLNWNSIQTIEAGAFEGLTKLQVLDISHNNVHALEVQLFAPLTALKTLNLGWNRQLVQSENIERNDLYGTYGITKGLQVLNLEACGLGDIVLSDKDTQLVELNLRHNQLTRGPKQLPKHLQNFDLSANMLTQLLQEDIAARGKLKELYLEDMPQLGEVTRQSLSDLPSLRRLSFQNSRSLGRLDGEAFGVYVSEAPPLDVLILRGTGLHSLNGTSVMMAVFGTLSQLDLKGVPLFCDCQLSWLKQFRLETEGICLQPARLRGLRVSQVAVADFDCRYWPNWVYGMMIFVLIILCAVGIYFIALCLRPQRGVILRNKVGAGSPYARVTIEPNNQEYNHF